MKKAGDVCHRLFRICQAGALLVGLEEVLGTGRFGRVGVLLDELVHAGLGGGLLVHLAEADALLQVSARGTVALGELGDDRIVGQGGVRELVALEVAFGLMNLSSTPIIMIS